MPTGSYRPLREPVAGTEHDCDPVGVAEVAQRLGVRERTVHMWLFRELLPEPDWQAINGSRAWNWATVLWWAGETRRLRTDDLVHEYREVFGVTEPEPGNMRSSPRRRVDPYPGLPQVPR